MGSQVACKHQVSKIPSGISSMKNEEYWNKRAASYDEHVITEYADANEQTVSRSLAYLKGSDEVLEIACGTGIMTLGIIDHVSHITAIDISSAMLDRLREKTEGRYTNLSLMHTDIFDHEFDDKTFDVGVSTVFSDRAGCSFRHRTVLAVLIMPTRQRREGE